MTMKPAQVKKFRSSLFRACNAFVKGGGKIDIGNFIYCPIGVATHKYGKGGVSVQTRLRRRLGFAVSNQDMWSFIRGFDGFIPYPNGINDGTTNMELYKLGQEFRKKYLGL